MIEWTCNGATSFVTGMSCKNLVKDSDGNRICTIIACNGTNSEIVYDITTAIINCDWSKYTHTGGSSCWWNANCNSPVLPFEECSVTTTNADRSHSSILWNEYNAPETTWNMDSGSWNGWSACHGIGHSGDACVNGLYITTYVDDSKIWLVRGRCLYEWNGAYDEYEWNFCILCPYYVYGQYGMYSEYECYKYNSQAVGFICNPNGSLRLHGNGTAVTVPEITNGCINGARAVCWLDTSRPYFDQDDREGIYQNCADYRYVYMADYGLYATHTFSNGCTCCWKMSMINQWIAGRNNKCPPEDSCFYFSTMTDIRQGGTEPWSDNPDVCIGGI